MPATLIDNDCLQHIQSPIEHQITMIESSFNPFAIGIVNGRLERQPRNKAEAIATAKALHANGWNFSTGCRQVNVTNLSRHGLTLESVFDASKNSAAGTAIYNECRARASKKFGDGDVATRAALSCYYSGDFSTGQRKEGHQPSYVDKVLANAKPGQQGAIALAIPVIPSRAKATTKGKASAAVAVQEPRTQAESEQADWDVFNEL